MRGYSGYDRFEREKEVWHLRGKLRLLGMAEKLRPIEEILARASVVSFEDGRRVLRTNLDDRAYELKVYRRGLLRKDRPLEQLEFATAAAGGGIDVTPLEGACVAGGHVVLFQEDSEEWLDPAAYLASPLRPRSRKRFLESLGRYCRRLHDAGFYQPAFSVSGLRTRVFPERVEFRVHDLDAASVREFGDDERLRMLGHAWQKTPITERQAMRFLRAYVREGENLKEIAQELWRQYGRRMVRAPARRPSVSKFELPPYEVHYLEQRTTPKELLSLYRKGLKSGDLRIVRSPDVLQFWKRILKGREESESEPIACFVRSPETGGFILYREPKRVQEPS
jgi:hypothetical protein